jgi:diguanylate cyclase (GGDEF)-like protein
MMSSLALIIEDDPDTGSLFSHILEFIGFTTQSFRSGEQALVWLRERVPDIVLLDVMLAHEVSGVNILDHIKSEDRLNNCRVMVITGHPNYADSIRDKADLVLLKPISARQLSTMVLRLVPNHISENFLYNASHDPLTGLMNCARFKDRLTHALGRSKRTRTLRFAIILIQIHQFSKLQLQHGQAIANQLLLSFVDRLSREIREIDTFSRLGEDKFAILLEDIKIYENESIVLERLQWALERPFRIQNRNFPLDVSLQIENEDLFEKLDDFLQQGEKIKAEKRA